jgi:hypothetical protein
MVDGAPDSSIKKVNLSWLRPPKSAALLQHRINIPLIKVEKLALALLSSKN